MPQTISSAIISPVQSMELLSQMEMASLANTDEGVHALFRRCALAILNTGSATDNAHAIFDAYETFDIRVLPEPWGLQLEVLNAPAQAFVDGRMLQAIRSHLFAALRDIVYVHHKLVNQRRFDFESGEGITDAVFRILRNAGIVRSDVPPRLVVCCCTPVAGPRGRTGHRPRRGGHVRRRTRSQHSPGGAHPAP